jgi:hypothetical protein
MQSRSLVFSNGFSITSWLMTGRPFDIVDFIIAEIEDIIFDGLTVAKNM